MCPTIKDIPFMRVNKNGTYDGYCVDLMDYIARALNFTYEIRIPEDKTYGIYQNGSWSGVMKDFLDGVIFKIYTIEKLKIF